MKHKHLDDLFPFRIRTSKGHYVVLQSQDEKHAREMFAKEESHRGKITLVERVE